MNIDHIGKQFWIIGTPFDANKLVFDLSTQRINKPSKAMWTSTFIDDDCLSAWMEWCMGEDFSTFEGEGSSYIVTPKDKLKLYQIDTYEDIENLYCKSGFLWNDLMIDFKKYKEEGYDGINLTGKGNCIVKENFSDALIKAIPDLCCWDCESTVWLHGDWFKTIEPYYIRR